MEKAAAVWPGGHKIYRAYEGGTGKAIETKSTTELLRPQGTYRRLPSWQSPNVCKAATWFDAVVVRGNQCLKGMLKHKIQVLDMVWKAAYNISVKQRRVESPSGFTLIFFCRHVSERSCRRQALWMGAALQMRLFWEKEDGDDIVRSQQMLSNQHRGTSVL